MPMAAASFFDKEGMITDFMGRIEDETPLPNGNLESELIPTIIQAVMALFATLLTAVAVWSGVLFVTQFGDANRVTRAKGYLIWSLVGIAVTAVSYAVIYGVLNLNFAPV